MIDDNDSQLISDYLSGDENSFRALVLKYIKPIYSFAYRLTGSRNDADDITQEVFVKVWKNIKKYNKEFYFKTWLFTIARNTVFDHLRKNKAIVFTDMENEDGENNFLENIADENEHIEDLIFKAENTEMLKTATSQLPKNEQEILSLKYEDDFTFEEISKILNKPLNTIKSQHRRIIFKLKNLIAPKHQDGSYTL